jgi:hypothetical protein
MLDGKVSFDIKEVIKISTQIRFDGKPTEDLDD